MMDRRTFLRGALTLTAATALSTKALAALEAVAPLPVLYGDGIGDDTAGLQALLDGKPFRTADGFVGRASRGSISGARLCLTDTIYLRTNGFIITGCSIESKIGAKPTFIPARGAEYGAITRNFFQCSPEGIMVSM